MDARLPELVHQWANDVLVWIGFGTLVGLAAKAIMPGRDQGGAVATLLMGIAGTVIGSGTLVFFCNGRRVTPVSPIGFLVAVAGAFTLLFFHRMLGGAFFREEGTGTDVHPRGRRSRHAETVVVKER